jgi:hypothetical protein
MGDPMADNLVPPVMRFLTRDNIGRIALALRLDRSKVESAIGVALPGLLSGLSDVVAEAGGPQRLGAAARREIETLDRLSEMLGATESLIIGPSQLLSSLLDVRSRNLLTHALSQFAGLSQDESGLLLGLLIHIVMGTVAQQQGIRGFGPSAMTKLFAAQKDTVAAALPAEFRKLLSDMVPFDSFGGVPRTAAVMRV